MYKKLEMRKIGLILTVLSVSGCATSTPVADSYCLIATPIYSSDSDTEETRRQIDSHNAAYDAVCGG